MLRHKRGADFDLSDSDDGGQARRRMKRRQFAKMQKALFADERVKKMAENPGNQAFLKTIEDQGGDDDMGILDIEEAATRLESQSQPQPLNVGVVPDSQPETILREVGENRPPAHMRRTKDGRRPANLVDVRETLSNLLEETQGSVIPATEFGSDSENDEQVSSARNNKENQAPRRGAVVDRISLKRESSSLSGTTSRPAFTSHASTSSSFKVPALLRRATTNNSLVSSSGTAGKGLAAMTVNGTAGSDFGEDTKMKRGGGKKSGVHAFAREGERKVKMHDIERRRQEKKLKGAEKRMGLVGGILGRGSFE